MKVMPLLSWDIFINFYFENLRQFEKKSDRESINKLAKKFNWKNNIDSLIDENEYEAIVITDMRQKIIWVNNGFTEMTGYPKNFALDKRPTFLQGEATSEETKAKIREHLRKDIPFKEVIINYKKDKTPYKCEVQIIPLVGEKTTHYIALERQVG
jgi:PAS domain S-box-containing protein